MIIPRLKSLHALDLSAPELPDNPENCWVNLDAVIGPEGSEGGDNFSFAVVTPNALAVDEPRWGRGLLIVSVFSWPVIHALVERLLSRAARPSWPEVAAELAKELNWEFERYRRPDA